MEGNAEQSFWHLSCSSENWIKFSFSQQTLHVNAVKTKPSQIFVKITAFHWQLQKILWLQKLSKEGWIWKEVPQWLLTLEWRQRTQKRIITFLRDRTKTTQLTWTISTWGVQYPKSLSICYEGYLENINKENCKI